MIAVIAFIVILSIAISIYSSVSTVVQKIIDEE